MLKSRGGPGACYDRLPSLMQWSHDPRDVELLISSGRFNSFLEAGGGDYKSAVELYEWNAALTAASFEAFHYVEVIVRNAIDRELQTYFSEAVRGIPWFLLPVVKKHQSQFQESIERVRLRLRTQSASRETRGQIVSGVDFGFWTALLHTENEELWRQAIYRAFPNSSGKRKDVVTSLEALRLFRNRLAHHDSLLAVDVAFKLAQMKEVLSWVDTSACAWLDKVERVSAVIASRPVARRDTVVVAAKNAWPTYQAVGVYICQPGRSFQPVSYLAFYADREIKRDVPKILWRRDNVDWSDAELNRLRTTDSDEDRRLADIIVASRAQNYPNGRYQVFNLTAPGQPGHVTLHAPIKNSATGRGSAFTQGHRYIMKYRLERASETSDLA